MRAAASSTLRSVVRRPVASLRAVGPVNSVVPAARVVAAAARVIAAAAPAPARRCFATADNKEKKAAAPKAKATATKAKAKGKHDFDSYTKHADIKDGKILIIGMGSIGKGVLPLLLRHIKIKPEQIKIVSKEIDETAKKEIKEYGVSAEKVTITKDNMEEVVKDLKSGDFILNLSVDVSSCDLVSYAKTRGILYLDTCIEPWAGGYMDKSKSQSQRSNYALREESLALKEDGAPTAVMTHGANPGFVSYFTKQALMDIAEATEPKDSPLRVEPTDRQGWGKLMAGLGVKVIHIAERDTQYPKIPKQPGEFVNTWSIDGFVSEGCYQPAELGWGTHEKTFPHDGARHEFGCGAAIFLKRPGVSVRIRTWTPMARNVLGFLVTHSESISIADYFTLKGQDGKVTYRPTVHYAYHPCDAAVLSLHETAAQNYREPTKQRLIVDEIVDGVDELGVLLMGHKKGAYWFGSQLSVKEARKLCPYNNATSLQVCVAVLAGVQYAINNPRRGVVDADEIPFRPMMDVMRPYLGPVVGKFSDWTPLNDRNWLWKEDVDESCPWQFKNFRVLPPLPTQ